MLVAVLHGYDFLNDAIKSSLLLSLLDRALGGRKSNFAPTARHCPASVSLAHEQNFIVLEYRRPRVDLWRLIPDLVAEQILDLRKRQVRPLRQHLSRNPPYPLVAFVAKFIVAVVQARLRYALQLPYKFKLFIHSQAPKKVSAMRMSSGVVIFMF